MLCGDTAAWGRACVWGGAKRAQGRAAQGQGSQLQHAVVLGGGQPLGDGLAAIAARFYCEVCGVATTSENNLQVGTASSHPPQSDGDAACVIRDTGAGLAESCREHPTSTLNNACGVLHLRPPVEMQMQFR